MMYIYPESFYKDIEFDQILEMAADMARGAKARQHLFAARPFQEFQLWKENLETVHELAVLLREDSPPSLGSYEDVTPVFPHLDLKDYILDLEEIIQIWEVLSILIRLKQWGKQKENRETKIYENYIRRIDPGLEKIYADLNRVFYPDGTVRENATPSLQRLHRQLDGQERRIAEAFQKVVQKYRARNLLTEPYESFKNGKQVLCVPAANKRNVPGLIQDESSSGQTVYVDPDEINPLYHELNQIRSEIRQEIFQLVRQISGQLRDHAFACREGFMILTACDIGLARARLANELEGTMPIVQKKPILDWNRAFHPILKWRNRQLERSTIPFDLVLTPNQRMVLVSGPNAGGKSVLLKAVALNQMMIQSGFLIPVDDQSRCGMFTEFFADIGDQQSLEEDLSTYSSHLKNMRIFLRRSGAGSMVLIDEMGSGTDPQYGGAIAEGVLDKLLRKKVWGVVTTHYFNLKMYADKSRRISNAAMSFDKKNLEPTYRFIVGKPGSSFAYEIARKSGLDRDVIRYAQKKGGQDQWAIEEMLVNLENEKHQLARQKAELEKTKKNVDQLIKNNKALADELAFQRTKWKKDRKQMELVQAEEGRRKLQQKIRELEQKESAAAARKMEAEKQKEKEMLSDQIEELDKNLVKLEKIPKEFFKDLKVGDFVRYKDGEVPGKITAIRKQQVELEMGAIRMMVRKKDLRPAKEPMKIRQKKSVDLQLREQPTRFEQKIDIRGYTISEAEKELDLFLDAAIMANASFLTILHGKGSGALRQVVREKLKEFPNILEISHPPREQGGDGVTIVKM